MKDTRVGILNELERWSKDPGAPPIFWLAGMMGVGKTSVAWSFCEKLNERGTLGGSFFCSRTGSASLKEVKRIIPTLAHHLALKNKAFRIALNEQLDQEPDAAYKYFDRQIQFLLKNPLAAHSALDNSAFVMVIDALDECSENEATADMLKALIKSVPSLRLKFFITSRPENHIRGRLDVEENEVFKLHEIESSVVNADIRLYLRSCLRELRPRDSTWYQDEDIEKLTQLSNELFIFASTAIKYIKYSNSASRLRKLVDGDGQATDSNQALEPLNSMYSMILEETRKNLEGDERLSLKQLLSSILAMRIPLSICALAELLGKIPEDLRGTLDRLNAVIYLPEDNKSSGLRFLHVSFGDFLTERAPNDMRINLSMGHCELSNGCFDRMSRDLCFNISRTPSSYFRHPDPDAMPDNISVSLRYACLHWPYHVRSAPPSEVLRFVEVIDVIFRPRFLFWLEVLVALGRASQASGLLFVAQKLVGFQFSLIVYF
jgi:hypothetical protein